MIPSMLDNSLGFNIYRVNILFRREFIKALAKYEMTPEQWQVMITLWVTGKPVSQREIVQDTLKDKHTVSRIIHRLERDGWIAKIPNPADGRITMIQPTEKGESMKEEIPRKLIEHFDTILADFDYEEIHQLIGSLKKLRSILGDL